VRPRGPHRASGHAGRAAHGATAPPVRPIADALRCARAAGPVPGVPSIPRAVVPAPFRQGVRRTPPYAPCWPPRPLRLRLPPLSGQGSSLQPTHAIRWSRAHAQSKMGQRGRCYHPTVRVAALGDEAVSVPAHSVAYTVACATVRGGAPSSRGAACRRVGRRAGRPAAPLPWGRPPLVRRLPTHLRCGPARPVAGAPSPEWSPPGHRLCKGTHGGVVAGAPRRRLVALCSVCSTAQRSQRGICSICRSGQRGADGRPGS
jgi:hypothetical protein